MSNLGFPINFLILSTFSIFDIVSNIFLYDIFLSYGLFTILDAIEKYNMFNSVYFSDGPGCDNILKLIKIKNDISISVPISNKKDDVDKVKNQFPNSTRIIYSFYRNNTDEETVKYIKSLGQKVKINEVIDDRIFIKKLLSWGVDYLKADELHSFLMEN